MSNLNLFNNKLASKYKSPSQKVRVLSEDWVTREGFCLSCGKNIIRSANNSPVLDFHCPFCLENYELKSKKNRFGLKIVDGAHRTMMERLECETNPSLFLLNYMSETWDILNFFVIPKHFFVSDLIEKREPLLSKAKRDGWTGCNILLDKVPEAGRIFIIRNKTLIPRKEVFGAWQQTLFLREERVKPLKGWILLTMQCIDRLTKPEFKLDEMYGFENDLKKEYPNNRHIKDKIRQQLQYLRNIGYLEFVGRGKYRKTGKAIH